MEFLDSFSGAKKQKRSKLILTTVISLIVAILSGVICATNFPSNLEYMASDAIYQNAGVIPDNIKIIGIDDKTLERLGPYSDWNREYFAQLINFLNEDENSPSVIGIDVVFSGSNNSEGDKALVEACRNAKNVVLASSVNFDSYLLEKEGKFYRAQYVSSVDKPFDELNEFCDYGFTNAIYSTDGVVREAYTVIESEYKDETSVYSSMSYVIASKISDIKSYPYKIEPEFTSNPGEFEIISMADVLDKKVPASYFDNCIVLVGAYDEGMMDSYRVPVDYSSQMYGVEMQANYIHALLTDSVIYPVNSYIQVILAFVIVFLVCFMTTNLKLSKGIAGAVLTAVGYILTAYLIFIATSHKLNILAVPIGIFLSVMVAILYKYVRGQKKRMLQMQKTLFSMAEAMAETIEGRTPYNANHTKNVARRSVEMLDYINKCHKEKKTELFFTKEDKRQMYLAAMLHDVGKMDVPLEVMDKPTKLGAHEKDLRARLEIISLKIRNDMLNGIISESEGNEKLHEINRFTASLNAFNCGRPLSDEEWTIVDKIADSVYKSPDGEQIPYLTEEEIDDLHINAGTLSEKERIVMQSHVIYTDKILAHIHFGEQFKNVRQMASNHHELLNGKGYPNGINEAQIDTMTRILTIMDIYDSLIADDRPYKKAKPNKIAFEILDDEARLGKIDATILKFAKELYFKEDTKADEEKN